MANPAIARSPAPVHTVTIWIDGQWHSKDSGRVSVFDHGLLYGDGVFEGIRVYAGKVFKLKEHLDRIYDCAHAILLSAPNAALGIGTLSRMAWAQS